MKPKRIISLLLAICLVAGLMPTVAFATGSNKAIMLGTEHLQGGQADNIYFGNYAQTDSTGNTKEPVKWRVLKNADGQLFLLSDQNLDVFQYHTESESVTWETSTMRSWLNGYSASHNTGDDSGTDYTSDNFIDTAFSDGEQGAIVDTTVVNDDNPDYKTEGGENTNDKIFLLSIAEAQNSSYFTDDSSRIATNTAYVAGGGKLSSYMNGVGAADYWWLRSPGYDDSDAADVDRNGGVFSGGIDVYNVSDAVRPAFNLNLNSVLFTSAAVGGKSASGMDSGLTAVGDYDGNEWKLTLLDETREFAVTEQTVSGAPGGTITLNYTGATTGTNEYISVIIADSNGSTLYYGRVAQPDSANGQVEIKIPDSLAAGEYTLNVFSEQYNGDYKTDYASAFAEVALTVSSDTTAPTLTPGSATRDSETAATVKFTSDEAGEYYYAVVESGAEEPSIDTTVAGTSCISGENTISLTTLTGLGAKDLYIVVKDAAGNVSQQLKITIPAYIAPSYGISASPAALDFGSKTAGYTEAPAAQTVTLTNTGNQTVTVNLPVGANYTITAGDSFAGGTATLAPNGTAAFTVQPNTGLDVGSHSETLNISGSDGTSASVKLSFTVAFATGSDKAIMLGTEHLQGGQADNIYFGTYQQSSDGSGGYNTDPIKWRVLENANGQLFLLSDQNLDVFQYHTDSESVTWEKSTMRSWLNGYGAAQNTGSDNGIDYTDDNFIDTAFSDGEQGAIVDTTVVNDDNPDYKTEGGENTNDKIFLLSVDEARNSSYFADDNSRIATNTAYVADGGKIDGNMFGVGAADYWWLRSPGNYDDYAVNVSSIGGVNSIGDIVYDAYFAVRPAFNLDLTSVLFTSAAEGGKSASGMDSGLTAVGDYDGSEWKLTLLDETREFAVTETEVSGISGGTVTLNYTGTTTGTNEYISVILADENGAQYYGRVAQPTDTDGTVEITIPSGLADGTYTLYVFSEQYNGGEQDDTKLTDYASAFEPVALTVSSDTTAPTLTPGSATRDSETAATVKFTSDEAGEYYYAVVESGDTAPTIDTTGDGTTCISGTNTISISDLTDTAAKDIYIVVKDAAGNVSQPLKITIPVYIAPSYGISASPAALNFGSKTVDYTEAPAAQTVTLTNTGNQNVTVDLPTSTNYIITAGEGFTNDTATLAPNGTAAFTVQPKTGLGAGDYSETLTISGSNGTSANVQLSFTVAFATGSDKVIMRGTEHLQGGQADNIYFGTYQQSSDGSGGYNTDPIKWRVLENADGQLFLLSDQNLDVFQYHTDSESVTWEKSTMRSWLNGYSASHNTGGDSGTDYTSDNFIGTAFSEKEQGAIADTTVVNDNNPDYSTEGGENTNDKIFLLSIAEAQNSSYFADDNSRIATNTAYVAGGGKIGGGMLGVGEADNWWLRSPGIDDDVAAYVNDNGGVRSFGPDVDFVITAVRPAFNLDLTSVLFTSAAVGGKSASGMDSGLTAVGDYDGSEWKLTLLDETRNSFEISNATITDTITFSYSGAATGTNEYISAVVVDNGAITHYGRILQPGNASGTASFTIPDGVTLSDTVKLYVFNEQYNSDKMTDYASQLKEISSSTDDTTDPTLSNGSATRDSETTATVKFTSSEAGSYYYEVVNSGENQPTIDTDGTGTTCGTTEQTISLTNLSDTSAKDIYIVVKDAAGNVSQPLTIQIPAYTSTTFTVTVNVDPSDGGTASANYTTAAPNTEITLTATPSTGYHFKEWQVTEGTASIGDDNKFTMPAEDVTVKAVFEAHSFTQENTDSEYLASSATCTQAATYYYSCSCGAKDTNNTFTSGEALGHTLGADWKYNDSNHWKECEDCGAKVDEAAHTFAWVTDKPATAAEAGSRHEQCTVCGYRKAAESIPPLAPEPDRGTDEHPEIGDAIADGTWGKTESAPADGETNTEKTVPATGDSSQPVLWIGLLAASGLGIAALLVLRRRKRQ